MQISEIKNQALKDVGQNDQDAFVKGALWAFSRLLESNDYIADNVLPDGSIKLGSITHRPYYILGPCLGKLSQASARKNANIGLWRLPDYETLKALWDKYPEVFRKLYTNGERYLMTSDTERNQGWTNACMINLETGKKVSCIPGGNPYPTRAIIMVLP